MIANLHRETVYKEEEEISNIMSKKNKLITFEYYLYHEHI